MSAVLNPGEWGGFGRGVGVEVAPGLLIAVAAGTTRVSMAALRRVPTSTRPSALPLTALLRQRHVGRGSVQLAICDPDHIHRTLLVPPMTAAERSDVVRRDIAREAGGERVSAWHFVRRIEVDGASKDELLVVASTPARLQLALDPIVGSGVIPRVVVTGPLALVAAARALAPTPLDRPTVLVHWGVSSLTIVILSDGVLKFARVIEPPASDLDPLDWIPVEIDRSIRRHGFLTKGERIEQMMVSIAEAAPARRLFAGGELAARVRLPMTNLNALLAPALPRQADVDSDLAGVEMAEGVYMLAFGAALLTPGASPNLLPPALLVQRRSRLAIRAAVAATILTMVALGSAWALMATKADGLRVRLAGAQSARRAQQARIEQDARIDGERQRIRQMARLLTQEPMKFLPVGNALREIARLAPDDLRLDHLTLSIEPAGYMFRLTGRVERDDLAVAQHTLSGFYYRLRQSPLFYDVQSYDTSSAAPAPRPVAAADAAPAAAAAPEDRSLPFILTVKPKELH